MGLMERCRCMVHSESAASGETERKGLEDRAMTPGYVRFDEMIWSSAKANGFEVFCLHATAVACTDVGAGFVETHPQASQRLHTAYDRAKT